MMVNLLIIGLFVLGFHSLLTNPNLLKKLVALSILNTAVIILFVYAGSLSGSQAPILVDPLPDIVDPLPQALMLTAIVVGISITAMGVCLLYRLYRQYGTLDIHRIEREHLREHQ